jgi:hypothetical protein
MKIGRLLPLVAASALLCGCKSTTVMHAITVTTAPDGKQTIKEEKSVSQYLPSETRTDSTKAILSEFDKK